MSDQKPYGSIMDRYRGTEFETPVTPPPPPPSGPNRGRLTVLLVAVIAVLVGGTALAISLGAGRTPRADPGTLIRDPGITPRISDAARILNAFWTLARDPKLAYHLEAKGESHGGGIDEPFELSLDVVGDDFTGKVDTIGGSGKADLIRLDGVVYIRQVGKPWHFLVTNDPILRQVPFGGLEGESELAYDAPVRDGTATIHRLLTTAAYGPSVGRMLDLAKFALHPDTVTLELLVADDGTPLRATFTCIIKGGAVAGVAPFAGSASYAYTNFGTVVPIVAPPG
jgi:hypothetical protein